MTELNLKKITEELIDTFLYAGEISLELREKGLIKEMKSDNTPVSNGDLEAVSYTHLTLPTILRV